MLVKILNAILMLTALSTACNAQPTLSTCNREKREKVPEECKLIDLAIKIVQQGAMERIQTVARDVGGIRVTVYSPLVSTAEGTKELKVHAFNTKEKRVLVFQYLYDSGGTELEERRKVDIFNRFLRDVLSLDLAGITFTNEPRYRVVGHSDLERTTPGKDYDVFGECARNNVDKDSNDCLALTRAYDLAKIIRGKTEVGVEQKVIVSYSSDFFMRTIDEELGGQLLTAVDATKAVNSLKKKWNLPEKYVVREVRAREDIQRDIASNRQEMRLQLSPFRSVVVIVD
jgi:hypothetical protein